MKIWISLLASLSLSQPFVLAQGQRVGQPANLSGVSESQNQSSNVVNAISYNYEDLTYYMLKIDDHYSNEEIAFDFRAAGDLVNNHGAYITFWLVDLTNLSDVDVTYADVLHYDTYLFLESESKKQNIGFYYIPINIADDLSFEYLDFDDEDSLQNTILAPQETHSFMFYAYLEDIPEEAAVYLDVHFDLIVEGFPIVQ